ncbi:hypothetical protein SELMODRAFT_441583 [Selaginella moellendorffii]|uniref:Uncharacterized protein n=1 Tax=Selaginella moellendorffii TaxID=88036 RepID=D8RKU5_SELML|nr:hypothetical protein SELMODRAFT_441583 [Selaginella moellendorffii]
MADSRRLLAMEMQRFASLVMSRRYDLAFQKLRVMLDPGLDSTVKEMLREASSACLRSAAQIPIEEKLELLDFLQGCFDLACDIEEQFVLRYETLILRETFCVEYPELVVSAEEWMDFARACSRSFFFSNAVKAYEMAMKHMTCVEDWPQAITEREFAVQAEALEVLKRKEGSKPITKTNKDQMPSGAAQYLSAIKKLNSQKLRDYGLRKLVNQAGQETRNAVPDLMPETRLLPDRDSSMKNFQMDGAGDNEPRKCCVTTARQALPENVIACSTCPKLSPGGKGALVLVVDDARTFHGGSKACDLGQAPCVASSHEVFRAVSNKDPKSLVAPSSNAACVGHLTHRRINPANLTVRGEDFKIPSQSDENREFPSRETLQLFRVVDAQI